MNELTNEIGKCEGPISFTEKKSFEYIYIYSPLVRGGGGGKKNGRRRKL